ncbi:MAG: SemiSWEET family transporter [Nanoarchaeota archaeon]
MIMITEIIGYTAAVAGTLIMIPQVIKSLKTKKVDDLAWGMLVLFLLNCVLWVIYGVLITAWPVIISNSIVLLIIIFQSILKYKYSSLN